MNVLKLLQKNVECLLQNLMRMEHIKINLKINIFVTNLQLNWNFVCSEFSKFNIYKSTAVCQVVACAPVTQWAWVRSPVGTSFLGEVFRGFSSPLRQMPGSFRPPRSPNIIGPSLSSSILIHYGRQ